MAENFDLIFGQNASQQYAWSDNDYQNGWETIGSIPPTAAQFDALQRRADMKSQELNSRLITVEESIAGGAGQKREADTTYAVGNVVTYDGLPMDWVLVCIVGGISGSADITIPSPRVEGARILDGTVTWALRKIATYGGIGYRQSSTACPAGTIAFSTALPAGWYLEATTDGTTSASDLVITSPAVGNTVTDGTVVWTIRKIGSSGDGVPLGAIIAYSANGELPSGYLLCDGSAVSRTMFPDLFSAIGTTYGAGDGSTTFNLPDYNVTERFVQGNTVAGTVKQAGLPNITGSWTRDAKPGVGQVYRTGNLTGAFKADKEAPNVFNASAGASYTIKFDASGSNSIYGNSTTVQPPALTARYIIKAFDGQTADSALIDITQYAARLEQKADINGSNMVHHKDVITTSGTYTAPVTGLYKITVKGGGGGGQGGSSYSTNVAIGGAGGGEGGTTIGWEKMIAGDTATVVIGAGGTGGATKTNNANGGYNGTDGGNSTVTVNSNTYTGGGGDGGNSSASGGTGTITGAAGGSIAKANVSVIQYGGVGGGQGGSTYISAAINGGGGGGGYGDAGGNSHAGGAGGDGYVWFEYYTPGA